MSKRNINYIKPEDPAFLKALKKQAGYDDRNHKFDKLQNNEDDFASDGEDEKPQIVVLKDGDLTAEQAENEMQKIEKEESEAKADLTQRVIFKSKSVTTTDSNTRKRKEYMKPSSNNKKNCSLLSFDEGGDDDDDTD